MPASPPIAGNGGDHGHQSHQRPPKPKPPKPPKSQPIKVVAAPEEPPVLIRNTTQGTIENPAVFTVPTPPAASGRANYFDNHKVEDHLVKYVQGGCISVQLRDQIMEHAIQLIQKVIRTHRLHLIYNGEKDPVNGELNTIAWIQLEKTLYKYKASPHCAACFDPLCPSKSCLHMPAPTEYGILTPQEIGEKRLVCPKCKQRPTAVIYRGISKIFNLWSQVARTVCLAHIKREKRDIGGAGGLAEYNNQKKEPGQNDPMEQFFKELEVVCHNNPVFQRLSAALKQIVASGEMDGVIGKLVKVSGLSRARVAEFLKVIRLRGDLFSF